VGTVTVGVDLGQRRDPSAVAVVERERRPRELRGGETHHLVRYLERLPLNTPYPAVAERVAAIVAGVQAQAGQRPALYLDATGVGTPIVDLLRAAEVQAQLVAVYFTHGDRRTWERGEVRLGKAWLVSRLQALLQSGRLHLLRTGEAEALGQELLDYEIRVDENANDRYGAFKVGTHDDLVTALGLATQEDDADVLVMPGGAWKPSMTSGSLAEHPPWRPLGGRYP
jgi:hypothetical protein